jgi:hypothetical protein
METIKKIRELQPTQKQNFINLLTFHTILYGGNTRFKSNMPMVNPPFARWATQYKTFCNLDITEKELEELIKNNPVLKIGVKNDNE